MCSCNKKDNFGGKREEWCINKMDEKLTQRHGYVILASADTPLYKLMQNIQIFKYLNF